MPRPWDRLSSNLSHRFSIFSVHEERYSSARTGQAVDAVVLQCADWVNVVALTPQEQVVMVRQFRFGPSAMTLEIPGGMVDPGEDPQAAAARELREETGYEAERWTPLGSVAPNPAFMRNRLHCFLAEGAALVGEQDQDPGEDLHVELQSLPAVNAMIADGRLDHALVTVAFHRLDLLRRGHHVR